MSESRSEAEELMRKGYAALNSEDYDRALQIAAQLRELRHSSTFEIEARARWANGDYRGAITVLEDGVTKAPGAGALWHWLGCYRSDEELYDAALEAFARESELENSGTSQNTYNIAIVHERMGRFTDALEFLDKVEAADGDPPDAYFDELRARLLFAVGGYGECIRYATRAIECDREFPGSDEPGWHVVSAAMGTRADAHLALGDVDSAHADIDLAIESRLPLLRTLDVVRKLSNLVSERARSYKLIVHARLRVEDEQSVEGFYVSIHCIADDPAEATRFAYQALPAASREFVGVEELHDLGPIGGRVSKGATIRTAFIYYREDLEAGDNA